MLIISSIVKRLLWRASSLAGGGRFYSGGGGRPPTGDVAGHQLPSTVTGPSNAICRRPLFFIFS